MGGGCSGTFTGTQGSASYQETFFPDPVATRRRGKRYASGDGPSGGAAGGRAGGVNAPSGSNVAPRRRRILIRPEDVLKQCQRHRFGIISEAKLMDWLQRVLDPSTYEIRPPALRALIESGIVVLQSAQDGPGSYNPQKFSTFLLRFEAKVERLLP